MGIEAPQFGFTGGAFDLPGVGGIAGIVTIDLQQLQLTGLGGKGRLLGGIGLAQVADFVTTGIELSEQAFLGHLGTAQSLLQQCRLRFTGGKPALLLKHPPEARHSGRHDTQHDTGQIQRHCHLHTPT
ncbi:hypothetical protein D9M71_784330 [compost metagenome]